MTLQTLLIKYIHVYIYQLFSVHVISIAKNFNVKFAQKSPNNNVKMSVKK